MELTRADLPTDWCLAPIREAYTFTRKPRGLGSGNGSVPFLPMEFIPIGKEEVSSYELRPTDNIRSGTYVENGDLLLAKITPSSRMESKR